MTTENHTRHPPRCQSYSMLMLGPLGSLLLLRCFQLPAIVFGFSTIAADLRPSRSVTLPLTNEHKNGQVTANEKKMLQYAFDYIVHSSDYFEFVDPISAPVVAGTNNDLSPPPPSSSSSSNNKPIIDCEMPFQEGSMHSSCRIPRLKSDVEIDFYMDTPDGGDGDDTFVLRIGGANLEEFGWICTKLYEERDVFRGRLETHELHQEMVNHLNRQPPSPGFAATSSAESKDECQSQQDYLKRLINVSDLKLLEQQGYVALEPTNLGNQNANDNNSFRVIRKSQEDLTQYLIEKTGDTFRSDRVHFLTKSQAIHAGIEEHYTMLLSIATFLNTHLTLPLSWDHPIAPATIDQPLTVPRMIQLAEYSQGDYYVAHSDNSYVSYDDDHPQRNTRNNFRQYTCILYCNDLDESDGGTLRLYLKSQELPNKVARETCSYVDILPKNGRLLIFDSCLVHSVEIVTSSTKIRRALTLWILRPNDSGVSGEIYF